MLKRILALAAPAALIAAAAVAAPKSEAVADYGRDLISVATPGRDAPQAKSGDCVVWTNAEGLGVGPAELGGMHGLAMHINVAPMAGDTPVAFAAGLAELKAANPKAPAWMFAAIEAHRSQIEARCAEDHPAPVQIAKLTTRDRR